MHRLASRELRRSRTYLWAWVTGWLLVALVCGLALGVHQLGDEVVRQPLGSTPYVLMGLFPAWFGTLLTIHWAPRLTFAFGAVLGVLFEAAPVESDVRGLGWVATAYAVAALVWLLWRDSRSVPRGPHVVPANGTGWVGSWAQEDARVDAKAGAAVAGALVLLGLIGLGIHWFMLTDVAAFEARAREASGTVVELIEDPYDMVVDVGGQQFTFERFYTGEEADEPQVGDTIAVLVDGDRATPVGQGQGNPAFVLGIAAVAPLLAAAVGLRLGTRCRRRHALLAKGGPSATVRLLWVEDFDALVLPVDDTAPTLRLINATGLRHLSGDDCYDEEDLAPPVDEGWDDEELPASGSEIAEFIRSHRGEDPLADLTDDERQDLEAIFGPQDPAGDAEPYIMVGSWAQGSTVALLRESGQVWFAEVAAGRLFKDRRAVVAAGVPAVVHRPVDRTLRALPTWALRNAGWLRWALAAGGAVLGSALALLVFWGESFHWSDLYLLAICASIPFWATGWFVHGVSPADGGLRLHGTFTDRVVARDRATVVLAVDDSVALRLEDPDELFEFHPEALEPGEGLGAEEAAERLRGLIFGAGVGSRSRRVVSPAVVMGVAVVVAGGWMLLG